MRNMDTVTQQNAAMVEESNAAAHNLATEADKLAAVVSGFVLDRGSATPAMKLVSATPSLEGPDAPGRVSSHSSPAAMTEGNLALQSDDWSEF
jgi:methyl-accepting chemotaxis protein